LGADATPPGRWIDSHCHLQDRYRPEGIEVADALGEAARAGVSGVVCVGTDGESSRQAIDLVVGVRSAVRGGDEADLPTDFELWATIGLHPHEASRGVSEVESLLDEVPVRSSAVVAVGECGLDYHYEHSPREVQRAVFAAQIALAQRHDLALVVHSREAWDDTIAVLREVGVPKRTVLHCFTGGASEARRCLDIGAFLSFSGIITFKGAHDVRAAAALCPFDRLLVETDAPFLAPVPHRGQQNRPAWVAVVGTAVAALKGVQPHVLADSCRAATRAVFGLT
jgi:TatD DNase family protein